MREQALVPVQISKARGVSKRSERTQAHLFEPEHAVVRIVEELLDARSHDGPVQGEDVRAKGPHHQTVFEPITTVDPEQAHRIHKTSREKNYDDEVRKLSSATFPDTTGVAPGSCFPSNFRVDRLQESCWKIARGQLTPGESVSSLIQFVPCMRVGA